MGPLPGEDGFTWFYRSGSPEGPEGEGCGVQGGGWGAAERESALNHSGTFQRRCKSVSGINTAHPHPHSLVKRVQMGRRLRTIAL